MASWEGEPQGVEVALEDKRHQQQNNLMVPWHAAIYLSDCPTDMSDEGKRVMAISAKIIQCTSFLYLLDKQSPNTIFG